MKETVLNRRQMLSGAGSLALLAGLWRVHAAEAHPPGLSLPGRGRNLVLDVACLGETFAPNFGSALANPAAGDFRGITFLVEGLIYPEGTIPSGAGFDPRSATANGSWLCRGWLIFSAARGEPHAITHQEYLLGAELSSASPHRRTS